MRLPGADDAGPTLEIYKCAENVRGGTPAANRIGWGHIAFVVDNVEAARETVRENGGADVGEIVTFQTADGRRVTWC